MLRATRFVAQDRVPKEESKTVSYTVLARRYRSREFDEVIGQEPIARTLKNAIANERTAHAYLFCGTRGVGKTSMARIFAKAINVTDDQTQKTEIGEAILRGDDLDVLEIDGASNRGINEARDLIAAAGLSPARSPYKIYIIDEVHALTKDAFNVLLKTMEEPPSHVKFILCTTEPQKVPATIQSRCQRFDFRPIPTRQIADHLIRILKDESTKAEDEIVMQIARLGNGSMRDALSLLDRLLAAGEDALTSEMIEHYLGLPDQNLVRQLADAIAEGATGEALEQGARLLASGSSIEQALEMLADYFRDLLVIATCGEDSQLIDLSTEGRETAIRHAQSFDASGLVHLIALCDATGRNLRGSVASRAIFDAVIARMSMSEHLADIPALLGDRKPAGRIPQASRATETKPETKKKVTVLPQPSSGDSKPLIKEVKSQLPSNIDDDLWGSVINAANQTPMMRAVLDDLIFDRLEEGIVSLTLNEHGMQRARYLQTQREKLETFISKVAGRRVKVVLNLQEDAPPSDLPQGSEIDEVQKLPLVRKTIELFDAIVVDVQDESSKNKP